MTLILIILIIGKITVNIKIFMFITHMMMPMSFTQEKKRCLTVRVIRCQC